MQHTRTLLLESDCPAVRRACLEPLQDNIGYLFKPEFAHSDVNVATSCTEPICVDLPGYLCGCDVGQMLAVPILLLKSSETHLRVRIFCDIGALQLATSEYCNHYISAVSISYGTAL